MTWASEELRFAELGDKHLNRRYVLSRTALFAVDLPTG